MGLAILSMTQIKSYFFVSVITTNKNASCKSWLAYESSIFFPALMEISLNLLAPHHTLITVRMEWQITKEKRSPLAAKMTKLRIATLRLNWWIWKLWNGVMDQTTRLQKTIGETRTLFPDFIKFSNFQNFWNVKNEPNSSGLISCEKCIGSFFGFRSILRSNNSESRH